MCVMCYTVAGASQAYFAVSAACRNCTLSFLILFYSHKKCGGQLVHKTITLHVKKMYSSLPHAACELQCLLQVMFIAAVGAVSGDENGMASSAHVMDDSAALNGSADTAKSHDMCVTPHAVSPRHLADATNLQQKTAAPGTQPTGQTKLVSASSAGRSPNVTCLYHAVHCRYAAEDSSPGHTALGAAVTCISIFC